MKQLGIGVGIIGGLFFLWAAFIFDTSVAVNVPSLSNSIYAQSTSFRVNNLGLMDDKRTYMMVSGFAALLGIFLAYAYRNEVDGEFIFSPLSDAQVGTSKIEFEGNSSLNEDAYKIFLSKKYGIEKNEALGKIVCGDRLFTTIDEALNFANEKYLASKVNSISSLKYSYSEMGTGVLSNAAATGEIPVAPIVDSLIQPNSQKLKNNTKSKIFLYTLITFSLIAITFVVFYNTGNETKTEELTKVKSDGEYATSQITYQSYKQEKIKSGWVLLKKREAQFSGDSEPDAQWCYEGYCTVEYTNKKLPNQILYVGYSECIRELNNCEGRDGVTQVVTEKILSQSEANKKFDEVKKQFSQ